MENIHLDSNTNLHDRVILFSFLFFFFYYYYFKHIFLHFCVDPLAIFAQIFLVLQCTDFPRLAQTTWLNISFNIYYSEADHTIWFFLFINIFLGTRCQRIKIRTKYNRWDNLPQDFTISKWNQNLKKWTYMYGCNHNLKKIYGKWILSYQLLKPPSTIHFQVTIDRQVPLYNNLI